MNINSHHNYWWTWNTSNEYNFFFLVGDLDKKVYMENLRGLLLKDKTKKSISLSSHYIICNKHINHGMKNLIKLCFQTSLKSTKLINIFI